MYKLSFDSKIISGMVWVILVSMYDHYLTIKYQETILIGEKNPIGIFLIELDAGSVALFMTLKMLFLWVILFLVIGLYQLNKKFAYVSLGALCLVQLLLITYLLQ